MGRSRGGSGSKRAGSKLATGGGGSRGGGGSKRAGSKRATGGGGVGGAGSGVSGACTGSGGFSVVGLLRFPSSRPSAVGRIHHGFKILAPSWRARGGLVVGHV